MDNEQKKSINSIGFVAGMFSIWRRYAAIAKCVGVSVPIKQAE